MSTPPLLQRRPGRILLVEDNPGDVFLTRKALQKSPLPFNLFVVSTGEEALDFLRRENQPRPDVILLDLNLPAMHGSEVLDEIKTRDEFSTIPVCVLTSSESEIDVLKSFKLRANSYLVKPIDPKVFEEMATVFKRYWFEHGRTPS